MTSSTRAPTSPSAASGSSVCTGRKRASEWVPISASSFPPRGAHLHHLEAAAREELSPLLAGRAEHLGEAPQRSHGHGRRGGRQQRLHGGDVVALREDGCEGRGGQGRWGWVAAPNQADTGPMQPRTPLMPLQPPRGPQPHARTHAAHAPLRQRFALSMRSALLASERCSARMWRSASSRATARACTGLCLPTCAARPGGEWGGGIAICCASRGVRRVPFLSPAPPPPCPPGRWPTRWVLSPPPCPPGRWPTRWLT